MISVVLPARNAAATLPAALESLAAQSLDDFEVLAVNDGSDDGGATRDVIAAFASRDARFRLLDRPPGGIVAALSAGLAAARGRFIARMDADDVCHPRRLELQARTLTPIRKSGWFPAGPPSAAIPTGPGAIWPISNGPTAC